MPTTPIYALPYPAPADPADVPLDMQELADRIEAVVGPGSANGQVPVWDNANKKWVAGTAPGGELAYGQVTANTTVSATSEGASNQIVAAPATTFDGSPVMVEFGCSGLTIPSGANALLIVVLFDAGTPLGYLGVFGNGASGAALSNAARLARRLTPSAGSHTYIARAFVNAGSGTISAGAGGSATHSPAFIRVTKA